jgi:hypothetical protein
LQNNFPKLVDTALIVVYGLFIMFTKPTKRVRLIVRDVATPKSHCITIYDAEFDEVVNHIRQTFGASAPESPADAASRRRKAV